MIFKKDNFFFGTFLGLLLPSILFFFGVYSLFISFFSILNILYSIYFSFVLDLNSYIVTLIISFLFGIFFCYLGPVDHCDAKGCSHKCAYDYELEDYR